MNNFKLHTPTRILFGKGAIVDLRDQIPQDARVLITYGGGSVKKTGVLAQVQDALKDWMFGSLAVLNRTRPMKR